MTGGPPVVSIVMAVHNGGDELVRTLESVLDQSECDFEFIVVNDGSTDDSGAILDRHAEQDSRLSVLHQENVGLTNALMKGCSVARGRFIARQDAGDFSLPGRLAAQSQFLDRNPDAVMTACAVRFSGPGNEPLYFKSRPGTELDRGLRHLEIDRLNGPPHHGATMFRKDVYSAVGGYRLPFVVAQDIDLWLRMSEVGTCLGTADPLYEAKLEAGSISSRRRVEQFRLGSLALQCARRRRAGGDEASLLATYEPSAQRKGPPGRGERARFNYFIASCLREHDPKAAGRYYRLALRENPFHLKALLRSIVNG